MSTREEPRESTYISFTESNAEAARLITQDQALTSAMGSLPRGLELPEGARVLDVACGPAGWACTIAGHYPAAQVLGVDISQTMLEYANAAAQARHLSTISFQRLDITKPWELADASFDLVNARLLSGFLSGEKWQYVIAEMLRVLVPGGSVILTETDGGAHTNSPAFETILLYLFRSSRQAGLSQHPLGHHMGITPMLGRYLQEAGATEIRQEAHVIDVSTGAPAHGPIVEDFKAGYKLIQPYILRQGIAVQQELDELNERVSDELEAPDFRALWYFLRIWGKKPT
jgi:ubiquinone/menaquinone biosynthesis C-methylase UbiE